MRTRLLPLVAGVAVGALFVRERRARRAAERFSAAALETLLNTIDANDAQTGSHVRRVACYALVLADALGLDECARHNVERVALFHDIGKIHEALFDIIHKHRRITRAERRAIATHPQRGAEVLGPLEGFFPELKEGVLAHHERWDGTGYPRRLRGERIPLAARIVAIADTFDAVTQARRYSAGRTAQAAADVLAEGRGTQFDPALVDLALSPPVFRQLERTLRALRRPKRPRSERRIGETERVRDVNFRWRSEASALPPRDLAQTAPRG